MHFQQQGLIFLAYFQKIIIIELKIMLKILAGIYLIAKKLEIFKWQE